MDGEQLFIDGECTAMQEDHDVIVGQPNMEIVVEDHGAMPNGDSIANVGDLVEMESQVHLILRVTGEVGKIVIGDVRSHVECGWHSRKSEFNEWQSSEIWRQDHGNMLTLAGKDFIPR